MDPQILQPDIFIGSIRLQEPVTTITDVILGVYCIYCAIQLINAKQNEDSYRFLIIHLFLLGLAVIIGGLLGHGFQYLFNPSWKIPGWYISMVAVMFMERSAIAFIKEHINHKLHQFLLIINVIELLGIMMVASWTLDFFWVEFHSVYGLLIIVLPCHAFSYYKSRNPVSKQMLYGILILIVAIFVFNYPIIIDKWFNNYDFAHTLMLISIIFFYRAGKRFQVRLN